MCECEKDSRMTEEELLGRQKYWREEMLQKQLEYRHEYITLLRAAIKVVSRFVREEKVGAALGMLLSSGGGMGGGKLLKEIPISEPCDGPPVNDMGPVDDPGSTLYAETRRARESMYPRHDKGGQPDGS
jgi:hypothetical protein